MPAGTDAWAAMRALAAKLHGPFCLYCKVPTAATAEHIQARTAGGGHGFDNIRVCCPYCNSRKGNRPLEQFLADRGWKLNRPAELPAVTREMLKTEFGWDQASGEVATSTPNSKLLIEDGLVFCLVRPHKAEPYYRIRVGLVDVPAVTQAAWDFLKRHHTPATRKRKRPPRRVFAKRPAAS
jgi:hypothetical protein